MSEKSETGLTAFALSLVGGETAMVRWRSGCEWVGAGVLELLGVLVRECLG